MLLRREGEYWTISAAGNVFRLRDTKGLAYLARLLERPGTRLHASWLAGRSGPHGSDGAQAERDRVSVTKNIKAAVRKLGRHDADLAAHLARSVKTGIFCGYLPIDRSSSVEEGAPPPPESQPTSLRAGPGR